MTDDAKIIEALARKMSYRDEAPDVLSALRAAGFDVCARDEIDELRAIAVQMGYGDGMRKAGAAQARADALAEAAELAVGYVADLNGCNWIKGDTIGERDMRQRAKAIQSLLYTALSAYKEGRSDG